MVYHTFPLYCTLFPLNKNKKCHIWDLNPGPSAFPGYHKTDAITNLANVAFPFWRVNYVNMYISQMVMPFQCYTI